MGKEYKLIVGNGFINRMELFHLVPALNPSNSDTKETLHNLKLEWFKVRTSCKGL